MPGPGGHHPANQLDDAPCGLLTTDRKGVILVVNATFCRWLGYRTADLIGRRRLQELMTMGGRIFHQTHWAPLLEMQGSVSEVKLDLQHTNGTIVPMVLNALRRERDGEVFHSVAAFIARDRDAYERELLLSRQKIEAAVIEARQLQELARDRALFAEQMVGIVSHDLRNPLSAISTGIQLLQMKGPSPDQSKVLELVARSTVRAANLIEDLLDFTAARMGTGLSVDLGAIDLHDTVAKAAEELSMAFPGRALKHVRSGVGICQADSKRLTQAIGNLVANAMSYGSPDSAVTITSSIDPQAWKLSVHNFGPTIPVERQASLFQPMVRGEAAAGGGSNVGLGLFIVCEIVKAHRGEMKVDSSQERGTLFELTVPLHSALPS
jgi:sigma-B regulation protein RsbU (phosphoserine phosphatase)